MPVYTVMVPTPYLFKSLTYGRPLNSKDSLANDASQVETDILKCTFTNLPFLLYIAN